MGDDLSAVCIVKGVLPMHGHIPRIRWAIVLGSTEMRQKQSTEKKS